MPVHDWTRVDAGIFHHFHLEWIADLSRTLNNGLLPGGYYALAEQLTSGFGPDVLTLQRPGGGMVEAEDPVGGVTLATAPPRVQYRFRAEPDEYAAKARNVVIRHRSGHRVVAMIEIISPGNKSNRHAIAAIVRKATEVLRAGIHLLVVDLFPPGPRDPQGLHKAIWDEFIENDFTLASDKPLTLAAYRSDTYPEAFVQPTAVGATLTDMPLFLSPEVYVPVPLETTYQSAWDAVPVFWREVLTSGRGGS